MEFGGRRFFYLSLLRRRAAGSGQNDATDGERGILLKNLRKSLGQGGMERRLFPARGLILMANEKEPKHEKDLCFFPRIGSRSEDSGS